MDSTLDRPLPVTTLETEPFWEGARAGRLVLMRCAECGRLAPPLAPRCPACLSAARAPQTCSGRVSLRGRTVLHLPALPGHPPPLVVVECAVAEEPAVMLVALDPEGISERLPPGAALRLGFATEANGQAYAVVAGAGA
ncbi:Zn-ribbon domain-containing OB-fold protein [Oceanicella sp. SM1341]|uniref:Zn-ribbon domain-containing OB-fold protein n=1 Tax=Oceanicella sp. SM1341 TaxID=1548889 RepID=UPI0018E539B9|nr:zinc ribbon domain-containing protein [Oceanicella sp. SM1341]